MIASAQSLEFSESEERRPTLRRLWQIPLLIAGLIVFIVGIWVLAKTIRPIPFETQVKGVYNILNADHYQEAINQINALARHYTEKHQTRQLECLAGDTFYYAGKSQEKAGKTASAENWKYVDQHYSQAVSLGAEPTPLMNERWGDAAMAMGNTQLAIEKYEAATAGGGDIFRSHARELITAYLALDRPDKAQAVLDRFLAEPNLDANERSWSLCKRIELALAHEKGVSGSGGGGTLDQAVAAAIDAVRALPENDPGGRVLYWIGRAELERGRLDQAQQYLADARKRFLT
ncbi:MAG: hypothetical protein FWD53_04220, partial [Phycisphaerales bacterium]|nr:hypothetical protein [Phycisphaerales bacterium]